jgi:hypothetical protein
MSNSDSPSVVPPAQTHADATELLRRPFAPGAIGFRAMTRVSYNGKPFAGAHVAAYLGAQSVVQRLNCVVPGRWRMDFSPVLPELLLGPQRKLYLACRLVINLPTAPGEPDGPAVFEDIGELDPGSFAGLKALYSDARKRVGVAAGIGAYLYTALEPVVLPIGPHPRMVEAVSRPGDKRDLLVIPAATEQWLRRGYATRMATEAVRRDLGEILAHGEPEHGIGQGDATELADTAAVEADDRPAEARVAAAEPSSGNGVVTVDFKGTGPEAA